MAVRCPICGKSFKSKRALAAHMARKHKKKAKKKTKKEKTVKRKKEEAVVEIRKKGKTKAKVIEVKVNLDSDKAPEVIRIYKYPKGSASYKYTRKSKVARVWGLND